MIAISSEDQETGIGNNGTNISFNYYDGIPEASLLQTITNNHLMINLKQLFKRDDKTKEKSLNNITQILKDDETNINDINILVWTMVYPKLVISESKFVRNLANNITFDILNYIKINRLKNLTPYYKDLLPVFIFTLQDSDRSVVYNSKKLLNHLFDNDEAKIDNLYNNFKVSLLKIIYNLTFIETEETLNNFDFTKLDKDSLNSIKSKHIALVSSAIKLLATLIQKNDESFLLDNEYLSAILVNEKLYDTIGINFVELEGTNGLLSLIELIIIINNKLSKKNYENKRMFWKSNKKALKYLSKKLFKLLSKWKESRQKLLSPTTNCILLLIDSMVDVNAFWKYDEESYKILFKWLLLGHGDFTGSGYYSLLNMLTCSMGSSEDSVLSLEKHWFKIWQSCLEKELSKNDKLNNKFFTEYWIEFSSLYKKFETSFNHELVLDMMLDSIKAKYLTSDIIDLFKDNGLAIQDVQKLLLDAIMTEEYENSSNFIIKNSVLYLNESELNDVSIKLSNTHLNNQKYLLFITFLISTNKCHAIVKASVEKIDDDSLLQTFVNSKMFDIENDTVSLLVPKMETKIEKSPESISKLITSIKNTDIIKLLINTLPQLSEYMVLSGDSNISSDLINISMANKMYETESIHEFISMFSKFNLDLKVEFINSNEHFIYEYIYEFEHDSLDWLESLEDVLTVDKKTVSIILTILQEQLSDLNLNDHFDVYEKNITDLIIGPLMKLKNYNKEVLIEFIINSNILNLNEFLKIFTKLDFELINVSGLELNTLLFLDNLSSSYFLNNIDNFKNIFIFAKFVTCLLSVVGDDNLLDKNLIIVNLNILQQLISHFCIITKIDNLELNIYNINISLSEFEFEPKEFIDLILQKDCSKEFSLRVLEVNESDSVVIKFYKFKIISMVLENMLDSILERTFNEEYLPQLEKDLSTIISKEYNSETKFINSVLLLNAIHVVYDDSMHFNKLITYLMSEFHQLNPSEFETKTYKYLIILINSFASPAFENDDSDRSLNVNVMRFNNFIKNIKNLYEDLDWYEDEVTYKQHFKLLFLQLFINLNKYNNDFVHNFKDFSEHLVIDNLQICELLLDSKLPFDNLLSRCIKLYFSIDFEIDDSDANESLFNIFLNLDSITDKNFKHLLVNQMDLQFISSKYDILMERLNAFEIKDLEWVNTCMLLVMKVLNTEKKVNSIDFELDRKGLFKKEEKEEVVEELLLKTYGIDNRFIELINKINYKENGLIYLWIIEIFTTYFKESTVNLFNLYLKQLGKNWFIDMVFEKVIDDLNIKFEEVYKTETLSFNKNILLRNNLYEISKQLVTKSNITIISNWYNNLKVENELVNEYFIKHISSKLIKEQMDSIKESSVFKEIMDKFSDFLTITVNEKFNIVKAKFDIDDQILDINYQYESNFPLQPISTTLKSNKIGIEDKSLKVWLLNLKRTSNILNNIFLICNNIKLKFANLEECAICYYIINDTNKSLPNKKCPTCFKKFHNVCLFKWFKNSNSNNCPLCRSNFTF